VIVPHIHVREARAWVIALSTLHAILPLLALDVQGTTQSAIHMPDAAAWVTTQLHDISVYLYGK